MFSANLYALRVNLSVAIVAMTTNHTVSVNGSDIQVNNLLSDFPYVITSLISQHKK